MRITNSKVLAVFSLFFYVGIQGMEGNKLTSKLEDDAYKEARTLFHIDHSNKDKKAVTRSGSHHSSQKNTNQTTDTSLLEYAKAGPYNKLYKSIKSIPDSGYSLSKIEKAGFIIFFKNDAMSSLEVRKALLWLNAKLCKNQPCTPGTHKDIRTFLEYLSYATHYKRCKKTFLHCCLTSDDENHKSEAINHTERRENVLKQSDYGVFSYADFMAKIKRYGIDISNT